LICGKFILLALFVIVGDGNICGIAPLSRCFLGRLSVCGFCGIAGNLRVPRVLFAAFVLRAVSGLGLRDRSVRLTEP
jgi:hypothetical protein